jgi:hypothetical protein
MRLDSALKKSRPRYISAQKISTLFDALDERILRVILDLRFTITLVTRSPDVQSMDISSPALILRYIFHIKPLFQKNYCEVVSKRLVLLILIFFSSDILTRIFVSTQKLTFEIS